jgi:hypothetical protein
MENFVGRRRKRNDDDVEEVEAENIQNHKAMKIREAGTIKTLGEGQKQEKIYSCP